MPKRAVRSDTRRARGKIIDSLRTFHAEGKYPSTDELASRIGMSESNVRRHIGLMQEDGLVTVRDVPIPSVRHEIVLINPGDTVQEARP